MKKIFLIVSSILAMYSAKAQNNPNANPLVLGINAATSPVEVGQADITTFDLGNNGSNPIPAGGATWHIFFPSNVTVNQATLNLDGGAGIFAPTWTVVAGTGTFLQLDVIGAGVPAMTFNGPETFFHMTIQIIGTVAGGPALQQVIYAQPNSALAQNANAGDDTASGPIRVIPSTTLPVHLVSFTGRQANEHTARLNWEISDPENFSHFELERSADGSDFSRVASVKLTAQNKYQCDDNINGLRNKVLYRLRMIDMDGSFSLSPVVALSISDAAKAFSLYPNPATGKVTISGVTGNTGYSIYTAAGRLVQNGTCNPTATDIDITALPAGTYMVRIASSGQIQTLKMIKK